MNKNEPMEGQNIPAYDWQKIGADRIAARLPQVITPWPHFER